MERIAADHPPSHRCQYRYLVDYHKNFDLVDSHIPLFLDPGGIWRIFNGEMTRWRVLMVCDVKKFTESYLKIISPRF